MTRRKRLTNKERCEAIRFVNAMHVIIAAATKHDLSDEEVALLVSVDVSLVRPIGHIEQPDGLDIPTAEAMADRLTRITAHDRMRLAAFRAETEQKPGTYCLVRADPIP